MIRKILKRLLYGVLIILSIILFWLIIPGLWSALNPAKPPLGYFSVPITYLVSWIGIEKLADPKPEIPEGIEEIQ